MCSCLDWPAALALHALKILECALQGGRSTSRYATVQARNAGQARVQKLAETHRKGEQCCLDGRAAHPDSTGMLSDSVVCAQSGVSRLGGWRDLALQAKLQGLCHTDKYANAPGDHRLSIWTLH